MRASQRIAAWACLPVLLLAAILGWRLVVADHGQCGRRCASIFGASATGERGWREPSTCGCSRDGVGLGQIARPNLPVGPADPGTTVCGTDGVTYPNVAAAIRTTPLHAGACGACSNAADIEDYRRTAQTLTAIATKCAFLNTIFGEAAGRACLRRQSGLSPPCVDCWVDNMSCTAAHCLGVCLSSRLRGEPRNKADGRLNDCLACDEAYCGGPFIRCAGANRRRAGILSDIQRPNAQLWRPGALQK